jgi:hypothetical protein
MRDGLLIAEPVPQFMPMQHAPAEAPACGVWNAGRAFANMLTLPSQGPDL